MGRAGGLHDNPAGSFSLAELYHDPATKPAPITLLSPSKTPNGPFQFSFTNSPNATFAVFAAPSPLLPSSNWTVLGAATEITAGHFEFTDSLAANTNSPRRFYRASSP